MEEGPIPAVDGVVRCARAGRDRHFALQTHCSLPIAMGEQAVNVRGVGIVRSLEDIGNIVLTQEGGLPVLISDVAKMQIGFTPRLGIAGRAMRRPTSNCQANCPTCSDDIHVGLRSRTTSAPLCVVGWRGVV